MRRAQELLMTGRLIELGHLDLEAPHVGVRVRTSEGDVVILLPRERVREMAPMLDRAVVVEVRRG